jgi:hypothetical protein
MKIKELPPLEYLQECFKYDANTGILTWKVRPLHHFKNEHGMNIWNSKFAGEILSCVGTDGYMYVKVAKQRYSLHRIIWKLDTGCEPHDMIYHIDGNIVNNVISNLRDRQHLENDRTTQFVRKSNNVPGVKGVTVKYTGKYVARIRYKNKTHHLGLFNTIEEASKAFQEAYLKYHGEF